MAIRVVRTALLLAVCLEALAVTASPCDSSSCALVTRGLIGLMAKRAWRVDFSFRYTDDSRRMEGSQTVDEVFRPKISFETGQVLPAVHEDLRGSETFVQLDVAYGLTSSTTLLASLPLLAQKSHEISHVGFEGEYGGNGFGDLLIGVRQGFGPRGLVGGFSVKLPSGRHEDGVDYDGGILDPTLQPGTGSFDFVPSLQYSSRLSSLKTDWTVTGFWGLTTTNDLGYRFGNQVVAAATASHVVHRPLTASLQVKYAWNGVSEYQGQVVASTGATYVYVTPGFSARLPGSGAVYALLQIPVYRYVNDTQLAAKVALLLGVSKTF
jgi:hypothetical protein